MPNIELPLKIKKDRDDHFSEVEPYAPDVIVALDLIQFCYMHVSKPIQDSYHSFFQHHHLSFDVETGQLEFKEKINRIFARNVLAYELQEDGSVKRLSSPILGERFVVIRFNTGDSKLNEILEDARKKYLSLNPNVHRESVERLWDAWERLKTIDNPSDKKQSIKNMLDSVAPESEFRDMIEEEATKLTKIGSTFHIRHSEVNQIEIQRMEHFEYLFHRLLSLI